MNSNEFTLNFLLKKRQLILQFCLLKYLKYEDIVKLLLVSKDACHLCDANKLYDQQKLKYFMNVIAL